MICSRGYKEALRTITKSEMCGFETRYCNLEVPLVYQLLLAVCGRDMI